MSTGPASAPTTYQDVKKTLQVFTLGASAVMALFVYFFLVPVTQRSSLEGILSQVLNSKLTGMIGTSALVVGAFSALSWFLVNFVEIHDKVYDAFITKWRLFYALDLILPTLTRPWGHNLDPRFFEVAKSNMRDFMRPYYDFVGDRAREHKVTENLLVRFYEAIIKYWITQITELLLFLALLVTFAFWLDYKHLNLSLEPVLSSTYAIIALFLINRGVVRWTLGPVRQATLDEIEDIHDRFHDVLESKLIELHKRHNLSWR